jgi:hypothetical protein
LTYELLYLYIYHLVNLASLRDALERGVDGLLASIEVFHFNDRLPQYKNIRLTNLKSNEIDIHDGKTWKKENKKKVLNDTLENHTYHLQTICDDVGNPKRIHG